MSYILSGSGNEIFSLRSLLVAPMLQSQILVSVTPGGAVRGVLSYQGLQVDNPEETPPDDIEMPKHDVRQQYAVFDVIQSGDLDYRVGYNLRIALTENSLENELFAFIPRNVKNLKPIKAVSGEE